MPFFRLLAAVLAMTLLAGCAGTATPSNRYTLASDAPATLSEAPGNAQHTLVLRPIRIASYLDSEGIVLQLDDITLNQAREHLWAEDLSRQLERSLRQRLDSRLADTRVLGDDTPGSEALILRVDVERFQGHHDGVAVASGQWQLRSPQGEVIALEPFQAKTVLDADGYPALVRALGRSWDQVADQLAARIVELR